MAIEETAAFSEPTPACETPRRKPWLVQNRTPMFLAVLVLFIAFVRWPMVKAAWYQLTGSAAPDDHIAWRHDYTAALAESAKTHKPALLDFSATWCPPCQAMKQDVWPDAKVSAAVSAGYIPVALDADTPSTTAPAQRYGVDTIPRVLVVDASGNVLRDGSYMSVDEMLQFLKSPPKVN